MFMIIFTLQIDGIIAIVDMRFVRCIIVGHWVDRLYTRYPIVIRCEVCIAYAGYWSN